MGGCEGGREATERGMRSCDEGEEEGGGWSGSLLVEGEGTGAWDV